MEQLLKRYPRLICIKENIKKAREEWIATYKRGGKLLLCGNGGSAADCEHIVGELMKSFRLKRPLKQKLEERLLQWGDAGKQLASVLEDTLPALSLTSHLSLSTAFSNDKQGDAVFAQQLLGLGKPEDTLVALSTSGNSENCVLAATLARAMGMKVISVTGEGGGKLKDLSDLCLCLPEGETYLVQELTLPLYHWLCAETERYFYG